MSIVSESTLLEVFQANEVSPTDLDRDNCLANLIETGVDGLQACVALAGFDIGPFLFDCATSANCEVADYADFDGYALIVQFFDSGTSFLTKWGVCLPQKHCLLASPGANFYDVEQVTLTSQIFTELTPESSYFDADTWGPCSLETEQGGFSVLCFASTQA